MQAAIIVPNCFRKTIQSFVLIFIEHIGNLDLRLLVYRPTTT